MLKEEAVVDVATAEVKEAAIATRTVTTSGLAESAEAVAGIKAVQELPPTKMRRDSSPRPVGPSTVADAGVIVVTEAEREVTEVATGKVAAVRGEAVVKAEEATGAMAVRASQTRPNQSLRRQPTERQQWQAEPEPASNKVEACLLKLQLACCTRDSDPRFVTRFAV
jgi:hypothetical protein